MDAAKVVVITGAANGIGRAVAEAYAQLGVQVVVADVDVAKGQGVVAGIKANGGQALFVPTDVSLPGDIENLFGQVSQEYGGTDVLINNTGVAIWKSPYDLTVQEWDRVINTNLRSMFLASREAAKSMRTRGGGAIVNISSTRAYMSEANTESYAASKGGIIALTHALAVSLGPDGIRVNAVSPGWIETGDYQVLRPQDHHQHPAGRVGKPGDIARACIFLTDPANGFITGTDLVIDGGMTRKMIYEP